ncbi:MAG: urate hydroxylase PuuD [Candidatus Binatia bacterium]
MEFVFGTLEPVIRWMHVLAGIIWIGLLYFFNFVNGPFAATMNADTKKLVVPELMPRALYWFRWGAAWTWATGVLMLMITFYHGRMLFAGGTATGWNFGALTSLAITFGGFAVYDALMTTSIVADQKVKNAICFVLLALSVFIMSMHGGFGYRGYVIHIGALLGTTMAFNVWFRIWPSQQKIIAAIKGGQAPDAALVALAGLRSRHNTYMSASLLWTMISMHTMAFLSSVPLFGTRPELGLLLMILVSWHVVFQLYKRSAAVKGF